MMQPIGNKTLSTCFRYWHGGKCLELCDTITSTKFWLSNILMHKESYNEYITQKQAKWRKRIQVANPNHLELKLYCSCKESYNENMWRETLNHSDFVMQNLIGCNSPWKQVVTSIVYVQITRTIIMNCFKVLGMLIDYDWLSLDHLEAAGSFNLG